jgi:hypothetical protein
MATARAHPALAEGGITSACPPILRKGLIWKRLRTANPTHHLGGGHSRTIKSAKNDEAAGTTMMMEDTENRLATFAKKTGS